MSSKETNALRHYGQRLIDAGYQPIPIKDQEKRPRVEGWREPDYKADLPKYLANGFGGEFCNVGIPARGMCVLDFDIYDDQIAGELEDWCLGNLPYTFVRINTAPKFMRFYRLEDDKILKKFSTPKFEQTLTGETAQIEVLGSGQQFVAYGRSETGGKIKWFTADGNSEGIVGQYKDTLPIITIDQLLALRAKFIEIMQATGYDQTSKGTRSLNFEDGTRMDLDGNITSSSKLTVHEEDNPFENVEEVDEIDAFFEAGGKTPLAGISLEQAREYLDAIPNDGKQGEDNIDYDEWHKLICGIHHQFNGSEDALQLALDFSRKNPCHDEEFFVERCWPYIHSDRDGAVTFATVIHHAKPYLKVSSVDKKAELGNMLKETTQRSELADVCDKIKSAILEPIDRELLAKAVMKQFKAIEGDAPSIAQCRELVRPDVDRVKRDTPTAFMDAYVYLSRPNAFYNLETGETVSLDAFDNKYGVNFMTAEDIAEGRAAPSTRPRDVALNVKKILRCRDVIYLPKHTPVPEDPEGLVRIGRSIYVNNYDDTGVVSVPSTKWNAAQKNAVKFIKEHALMTCGGDERDAQIFLSWLGWKIRNPHKKIGWAVIMQGTKGSGKSLWFDLLPWLLGRENVTMVTNDMLKEKYNSWSTRCVLNTVEEVKMDGYGKYDALNALRPVISQTHMSVRRMREDAVDEQIFNDILMGSNFQDCVPVDRNERRFFPVFSAYQTRDQIEEFTRANPDYFATFFGRGGAGGIIHDVSLMGAVRGFLEELDIHPDFNDAAFAPKSSAYARMISLTENKAELLLTDIIEDNQGGLINDDFVSSTHILDLYQMDYEHLPEWKDVAFKDRALNRMMVDRGYIQHSARPRIGDGRTGRKQRIWVTKPDLLKLTEGDLRMFVERRCLISQAIENDDDFLY